MPHATPGVDLIAEERRQLKIVEGSCQSVRVAIVGPVHSFTRSGRARAKANSREEERTRILGACFGLIDARHRHTDVLIGGVGFGFQASELRVAKYAPPIAVGDVRRTGIRRAAFFE